jgi:hypothetical protein
VVQITIKYHYVEQYEELQKVWFKFSQRYYYVALADECELSKKAIEGAAVTARAAKVRKLKEISTKCAEKAIDAPKSNTINCYF